MQHMKKDTRSVVEYSREFKSVCDQLAAMGHLIDDLDKIHWYLRGLGSAFSTFSTTQLSLPSLPSFTEIVHVDQKGKLTCENSLSYSWINYFSATSITRTKVIFHSINVFVNLVKSMQRVKMGEEKEKTMFFQIMKSYHFIWVMSLYI